MSYAEWSTKHHDRQSLEWQILISYVNYLSQMTLLQHTGIFPVLWFSYSPCCGETAVTVLDLFKVRSKVTRASC